MPGGEAGAPDAPNITPAGDIGRWSEKEFMNALRTGVTPGGDQLDKENMPWDHFAQMTDDELKAVWLYLKSVPAAETEQ